MKCYGLLATWVEVDILLQLNESELVNSPSGCINQVKCPSMLVEL